VRPRYFNTADEFRAWLEKNHDRVTELDVGLRKKHSGKPSITYEEAVNEALCFGWIDGITRTVDDDSYMIRFTPRRPGSVWSKSNVERVEELTKRRKMKPAGRAAFEARDPAKPGYSYEDAPKKLSRTYEREMRATPGAWEFFKDQPAGYQRGASFWVMSAKKEETRRRRLATLIDDSAASRRLAVLTSSTKPAKAAKKKAR
jgi:uncharacterized protein YdeI (YjbR/CyaY-like superfamily)